MSAYDDLTKLENSRNCLRRIARHDEPQCSKDSIINMIEKFVKTVKLMDETILIPCRLMDRQVGDSTDIIPAPGKNSTSNQLTLSSSAHGKRGIEKSKNIHEFLNCSELFNLYNILNTLKNELLWTGKDENADEIEDFDTGIYDGINRLNVISAPTETEAVSSATVVPMTGNNTTTVTTSITTAKGHVRRPSTASVASTVSVSNLSDSDSEISNENDSGMESESNKSDNPQSSSGSISSSENVCTQKKAANIDKATDLAKRCKRHLNGLYQCLEQMTEAANYLTARYQSDIGPV